ncbi:MAG: IS3 family transposase [Bacilli bacterium]
MFYCHEFEFKTLDEVEIEMEKYIDYYNRQRIMIKLKD